MILSHNYKLIFIHVHRTAGSALTNALWHYLKGSAIPLGQHSNARTPQGGHLDKYANYFKFGFTRNPWDRMLSWYALIHKDDPKSLEEDRVRFEAFLINDTALISADQTFHYNTLDYFTSAKDAWQVDTIYRYEQLESELNALCERFGWKPIELPQLNVTSPKNYRDYYTEKSRELVAQKCEKDILYFGYRFEDPSGT